MELTNCQMCQSSIPTESAEPSTSCTVCGADLSRWKSKSTPPPLPQAAAIAQGSSSDFSLGRGIAGALAGAAIGSGAMYGFFTMTGFRFPLLGVGIGLLTGYGAKLLYKGTDNTLGIIAGGIALISVVATLFLMYGEFPLLNLISVAVSVSVAYRIAK